MADDKNKQNHIEHLALRALSALFDRAGLAGKLGQQFNGSRNLYEIFGYKKILSFNDYLGLYQRGDLAARIIDCVSEATWRGGIKIQDTFDTNKDSQFEETVVDLFDRLKLYHYLERADKLAGLGRYSVLLIGTAGSTNLALPLASVRSPGDIIYISVFGEDRAVIKSFVENSADPNYGRPLTYEIDASSFNDGVLQKARTRTITVHASRVLHVADGLLEDEIFGRPRLEKVYNRLDDLAKVVGGAAEVFWLIANRGLHVNVDKDMELDEGDEKQLTEEIQEYQHQLRRFVRTRGVDIKSLGAETVSPEGIFKVILSVISGATGIPQRILTGSEMGQLASSQDRSNFAAKIASRQKSFAEPIMLRALIDRLITVGALPAPKDDYYEATWPDALVLNENEKAQRASQIASASSSLNSEVVSVEEFREHFLGLPSRLPKGE